MNCVSRIMILTIILSSAVALAQPTTVTVSPAPANFTYTIEEVYFKHPHTYKRSADRIEKAMMAVKVTVFGSGFRQANTGPIVWLNNVEADIERVSPDGRVIESFFYRRMEDLRKAGDGRWRVVYSEHRGDTRFVLGGWETAKIRRLTDAQWKHAQEIGRRFSVSVPDRIPENP